MLERYHLQPGVQVGVLGGQLFQHRRQQKQLGVAVAPQRQRAHRLAVRAGEPLDRPIGQPHHLPGVGQEGQAFLGDADGAGGAVEQLHPQFPLQRVDLLGHGGLGHMQLLGRAGKIERFGHGQKAA